MRSPVLGIVLALAGPAAADPTPEALDPTLATVEATANHRFVEYRVCSPEHCWSVSYLQWLADGAERRVLATVPIAEAGYGTSITEARWRWAGAQQQLVLRVEPSHGGFEPHTLTIVPKEPGKYESVR